MKNNPVLILITLIFSVANLPGKDLQAEQNSKDSSAIVINADTVKTRLPAGVLFGLFSKDDGPFLLEGSAIVPSGQILEFGPGCRIYVGGQNSSITVYGQILVHGQKDEPVIFMSANIKPNPWDWDRIYCRSSSRSIFYHCIIRNSNFGLIVENGAASIRNCLFENNSIQGLTVRNSEISLIESRFRGGHVCAINLHPGAVCESESLIVENNITAITCHQKSVFNVNGGIIRENTNAIVVDPLSSVAILSVQIKGNKNGILSSVEILRKNREMVFGNAFDLRVLEKSELNKFFNSNTDNKNILSAKNQSLIKLKNNFKPGFTALSKPPEPESDFLGNVTAGFKYFQPRSLKNPTDDSVKMQTHYPEKIQPEIQLFANGRRAGADINLLMDIYSNSWLSTEGYVDKRMFSLSLSYAQQQLIFGDFFENSSETSISGRQITGIKYSGESMNMGAGNKRLNYTLAAGESEFPKDSGSHEINIYNETVDTGMSVRQQLTYLASLSIKPTLNSSISVKGIISRDQTEKPLFRSPINDPAAPDPIEAQTGCIGANISFLENKLEIFSELDLGTHDTIDTGKADDIAWYNPDFKRVVPEIFSLFNKSDFTDHYAFTIGSKAKINEYNLSIVASQIAPQYFSAGNPYLEIDKRTISFSADRKFKDNFNAAAVYGYRRSSITESPQDNNQINITGEYSMGENKPAFSLDYTLLYEKMTSSERIENEDTSFISSYEDKGVSNIVALETKQNFRNGIDCGLRYQFLIDNDVSKHADPQLKDNGDRFQNQIRGWFSFRVNKYLKSKFQVRVAARNEKRDSLEAYSYKLQNQTTWNIIPRKLILNVAGEYNSSKETDVYTTSNPTLASFYKAEMEIKYTLNSRLSMSVMGSYEKSYDEASASAENYNAVISGLNLTCLF